MNQPKISGFGGLWYQSLRVQTRPKPSNFSERKNLQHAFLGEEVKAVLSHVADLWRVKES
jgi:hypothetical protein